MKGVQEEEEEEEEEDVCYATVWSQRNASQRSANKGGLLDATEFVKLINRTDKRKQETAQQKLLYATFDMHRKLPQNKNRIDKKEEEERKGTTETELSYAANVNVTRRNMPP